MLRPYPDQFHQKLMGQAQASVFDKLSRYSTGQPDLKITGLSRR